MKRKNDDVDQGGIKLRSGKVIVSKPSKLPKKLNDVLEENLQNFKTLFSGNPQHAKELLNLISKCKYKDNRSDVSDKIEEEYGLMGASETAPLFMVAGELMRLELGYSIFYKELDIEPKYYDLIKSRYKNFDLETPVVGEVEDLL